MYTILFIYMVLFIRRQQTLPKSSVRAIEADHSVYPTLANDFWMAMFQKFFGMDDKSIFQKLMRMKSKELFAKK